MFNNSTNTIIAGGTNWGKRGVRNWSACCLTSERKWSTPMYANRNRTHSGYLNIFIFFLVAPDPCSPNPCKNDGNCTAGGGGYVCECPEPFGGPRCGRKLSYVFMPINVVEVWHMKVIWHSYLCQSMWERFSTTDIGTITDFAILVRSFGFIAPKTLNDLDFQSFYFECTRWRLFQTRIVRNKFYIYALKNDAITIFSKTQYIYQGSKQLIAN